MPEELRSDGSEGERRHERRPVAMSGTILRSGGVGHVVDLIDLNYGGCGISTPVALTPGETVKLTVAGRGSIPAEVRWCRDGKAGLDFEPQEPAPRVERQSSRTGVSAEIGLRTMGRSSYRVRIFDLSSEGCKVELVERPAVGDQMAVKFDGLEVLEASVVWVEDYSAGLAFKNRVHPAVLDLLLERLNGAGG